jgi:hypothetical protein
MDARAQAAAAATGIPAGPVTIAITAHIHNTSGDDFDPTLKLSLTPLQLTLAGGANELTVTRTGGRRKRSPSRCGHRNLRHHSPRFHGPDIVLDRHRRSRPCRDFPRLVCPAEGPDAGG